MGLPGCETTDWLTLGGPAGSKSVGGASAAASAPSALAASSGNSAARGSLSSLGRAVIVLRINFDVFRVRVARGVFSESGKIWNHLDEEAIPADTALLLQRNGLRAARGKLDSWPPIKALLEAETQVETSRSSMMVSNGLPLTVELDPRPRTQVLFLLRADGHGAGRTYAESTNSLRIEYEIPLTDTNAVVVEAMPEIRLPQTAARFAFAPDGLIEHPAQRPARVLRELAFRMVVGPDEFFVIGPSSAAHQAHLAGSLFLCEEIEGRQFESMYFITPRVVATGQSRGP